MPSVLSMPSPVSCCCNILIRQSPRQRISSTFLYHIRDCDQFLQMPFMSRLSARLASAFLPQWLCASDHLVFHGFLGRWRAAVVRVLLWPLVFLQLFAQGTVFSLQFFHITAQVGILRTHRIHTLSHGCHLRSQPFKCLRHVRNLLFHRYKDTENIWDMQVNRCVFSWQSKTFFIADNRIQRLMGKFVLRQNLSWTILLNSYLQGKSLRKKY